jgi:thiamine-monophosphate kinase
MRPGEFEWIEQLARRFGSGDIGGGLISIGDDAAVVPFRLPDSGGSGGEAFVISVDAQVEGIHFRPEWIGYRDLARRLLHVGFSDVAAMGARAAYALVSVEVGPACDAADLAAFTDGMQLGLDELGARLIGGNVSSRGDGFSAHVTAIGRQEQGRLLYRSGARPGDGIYVTGNLGSAAAAISALSSPSSGPQTIPPLVLDAYLHPHAHIREGLALAESGWATSAIDISDGLTADLGHLCRASRVGAIIDVENLPVSDALRTWTANRPWDLRSLVLGGGEDYVLLFTAPADPVRDRMTRDSFDASGARFWRIGTITEELAMKARLAGRIEMLETRGFDHLRPSAG